MWLDNKAGVNGPMNCVLLATSLPRRWSFSSKSTPLSSFSPHLTSKLPSFRSLPRGITSTLRVHGGKPLGWASEQQSRAVRLCKSRREHSLSAVPCQTSFWCVHWSLICSVVLWAYRERLILQLAHVYTIRRLWCVITVYDATEEICTRALSIWYKSSDNYRTMTSVWYYTASPGSKQGDFKLLGTQVLVL